MYVNVCMYVNKCMYVCMYLCMYVCMYVYPTPFKGGWGGLPSEIFQFRGCPPPLTPRFFSVKKIWFIIMVSAGSADKSSDCHILAFFRGGTLLDV